MVKACIRTTAVLVAFLSCHFSARDEAFTSGRSQPAVTTLSVNHRLAYVSEAQQYAKQKRIRQDFFLLFDLRIHSGKKRLFLIDLQTGDAVDSFMVAHGAGKNPWGRDFSKDNPQTSNTMNSHLSSVGKYLVGNRDYSTWGINVKYWLYGQDSTNSNAVKRVVVLHSWDHTPDEEVYPDGTPESWGCPAVSDLTMKKLDELLSSSNKNMLLWIIN